ncbi:RNA-binding protein 34 isoform X1 [Prionailurus viverrinus]|uniref:RNA-binding protein 34 isoform X1 n=1 Tax=Prionailurus bengalensis TaxID=37029 RepID=UPI001CA8BE97|nr:RNA-binding protein 34 isoform X1 [Prionailurus bengalensis]XP_047681005.1 RNA-binding protein 34 isoform X1 [Prionailurus viverrinus]
MGTPVEGKSKRKKKKGAQERDNPEDGVRGSLAGDYVVGQVASSLLQGRRPSRNSTARLASLFSSSEPQLQPVYVPVPKETTKKRKRDEEEEGTSQIQGPLLQEPSQEMKVKKKLSAADKRLANRENALASADLEEEIHQKQGQKRSASQSGIKAADKKVLDDVDHTVVNQRKKIEINQEEERLKNERTVFVGNLPVTCNKKKLKSFFKEYGQIESVRFRSLIPAEGTLSKKLAAIKRKIHPDQKNINAYVVFKDESAATKALKRNGAQFADGFRVRVDLASETSSRDKRSVFVGNLPYKVEESAIEEHFLDCGSIVAVRIVRDPATGVGRGFGYVLFENTDAVHLALKLNNSELMGRKLRVMRSVNKEKLKPNSNPSSKNVGKPKQGLHFDSKNVGHSKSLFIGEKAVLLKKKKKGQKKNGRSKKQKKQK